MVVPQHRIFTPRLSFKLTLPYVALAMVLALATIYIVAQGQANKVTADFSRQIADARVRVSDSVVQTEREQIDNARTLARLSGLAQSLRVGNAATLEALLEPFAISQRIERIVLLRSDGEPAIGVLSQGSGVEEFDIDPAIADQPGVAAVLHKQFDPKGDKFVALVGEPHAMVLYTVSPVYDGNTQVGALMVGVSMATLMERWRSATLADVTLYGNDGQPLATSLGAQEPRTLEETARNGRPQYRTLSLGSRSYGEVVAPLMLRGATQPYFIGVAISTAGQSDQFEQSQMNLLPIFGLGLLATFLLGILLSQRITRPITALARAAEGVAAGNLDHDLPVTTRDEIGALTYSFNTMIDGLRERERMHDVFGRFVSPTIARLVLSHPLDLRGETKDLTILFTDLRDFTVMSEQEDPAVVIQGLNEYFQIVVDAAERHGGIVNKFGGDSTLVLFGLAESEGTQSSAEAAVRAAMEMRDGLRTLNECRAVAGLPLLLAGIGVNTGPVMAGLIGTPQRMEYTVIGDAVNLSARIQTLNRKLATDILISQATYSALGGGDWLNVTSRGFRRFKGKSVRVKVYSIDDDAAAAAAPMPTLAELPEGKVVLIERARAVGEVADAA